MGCATLNLPIIRVVFSYPKELYAKISSGWPPYLSSLLDTAQTVPADTAQAIQVLIR